MPRARSATATALQSVPSVKSVGDPSISLVFIKIKNQFAASVYWSQAARHRLLLGTDDPKTARTRFEKWKRDELPLFLADHAKAQLQPDDPADPTLESLWTAYEAWAGKRYPQKTLDDRHAVWRILIGLTGAQRVSDLDHATVEEFIELRLKRRHKQTINNNLRDLRSIFNKCHRTGIYQGQNPFTTVEKLRIHRPLPKFHTHAQLVSLLETARRMDVDLFRTVLLCGWLGLRYNEAINTRWEWFHWHGEQPHLHVQPGPHFTLKDHEDRTIPVPPGSRIRTELYRHRQPAGYVVGPEKAPKPDAYRLEMRKTMNAALKSCELPVADPFKILRSTFATLQVESGTPIYNLKEWLGHASIKTTERYYIAAHSYSTSITNPDRTATRTRRRKKKNGRKK